MRAIVLILEIFAFGAALFFVLPSNAAESAARQTASDKGAIYQSETQGLGQSSICPQTQPGPQEARYKQLIDNAQKGLQESGTK